MPLTPLCTRRYGSPLVHRLAYRSTLLALALLACAKGASRPEAPDTVLHFPGWMRSFDGRLLIANLNQDLAFNHGALVALDPASAGPGVSGIVGGVPVPNMAGQVLVVDAAAAGACAESLVAAGHAPPFVLVAGRFENVLVDVPLEAGSPNQDPFGAERRIDLHPFSASDPYGVGFTCSPDGTPRAWVSYGSGLDTVGYVSQVDLGTPDVGLVQVRVGMGEPRSFAYDAARDRLFFTSKEFEESAPLRWIDVGAGCKSFEGGIQDERLGGCHVDPGFDLSAQIRGAEPNEIALSSTDVACTGGGSCRRAYLSVRMYDADLAALMGARPSSDIGGKLIVLDLPEGGLGRPEPRVVGDFDIGTIAGVVQVIPRPGRPDLVAVSAVDDDVLWIYDDEVGGMVKVFGRDAMGVPPLGRQPSGIAPMDVGDPVGLGPTVRLFVTSYADDWVSAVDVPLGSPGDAYVVRQGPNPRDATQPILRLGVTP